jgi:hypothetical protein
MCRFWDLTVDGVTGFTGAAIVDGYPDREVPITGKPVLDCGRSILYFARTSKNSAAAAPIPTSPTSSYSSPHAVSSSFSLSSCPAAVALVEQASVDGTRAFNGSFAPDDISPDVSPSGSLGELQNHVCMGHIFVSADVAGGTIYGVLEHRPKDNETQDARTACDAVAKKAMEKEGVTSVGHNNKEDHNDHKEDKAVVLAGNSTAPAPAPSAAARAVLSAAALVLVALMP